MTDARHISVMAVEVADLLNLKAGAIAVDGTLGLGGHAIQMCERVGPKGRLIGIDQDDKAVAIAREHLKQAPCPVDIVRNNFQHIDTVLDGLGVPAVDGILLDIGVSSIQLDDPERGFSFRTEGPLDMRMDQHAEVSAATLVNSLSEEELAAIIWKYGEERFSRRIAGSIVRTRALRPITTTKDLADLVLRALPNGYQRGQIHPATRTFQALRIAVNKELEVLEAALDKAFARLKIGGRLVVIAFHSLEDRIVKEKFRGLGRLGCAALVVKKPLRPGDAESEQNPRSRSARLRAIERIA
ncbi:MAG: 16S rRNA (cytosine(1402)-N(4))-methyltransferase RsmH [Candidatus Omnitrophica bacterium]|nr:16S rRNA (cytosine(1402)-N(4))-methyltransferase RsmH [Candidatus Omnitrophota bacterium]